MGHSDARLTGDQKVTDAIPTGSDNYFMEMDKEIFSMVIISPFTDSRRAVISFGQKNVHKNWLED